MHIVIDCRFSGTLSGLGRYTREIASGLVKQAQSVQYSLIVRSKQEEWLQELDGKCQIIVADIAHYSMAEQVKLPSIIRSLRADLLFSPHFNVPFFCPIPFIATIHDLILHRYPNNASLPRRMAYRVLMHRTVRRAKGLIAISTFVQQELRQNYGASAARKASVVYQGVDERYVPQKPEDIAAMKNRLQIKHEYFLYVGNAKQHKNVSALIDGFVQSGVQHMELLLVTGGPEAAALQPLPHGVRFLKGISDADLPLLYAGAKALLTASLYEGFCLPVAEALACGTPVIASNRTAIPEIADGHALIIEPIPQDFAEAMRNPPPASAAHVVGRWQDTARRTREILLQGTRI